MTHPRWRSVVAVVVMAGGVAGCAAGAKKVAPSSEAVKASGAVVAAAAADAIPPYVATTPKAIKWAPFVPGGPGVQAAVLSGDPDKAGPFVLRIKSPAGAKMAPHWHAADAHVTVVSGTLAIGLGDVFDAKKLALLPAGSYVLLPRDVRHFAQSKTATVLQVHGTGPLQTNFVNPADDPRKKTTP
ncbi:MAG: cupin domain-containing protein [Myxococcales bacterium]|jgi:quercetin dioxygenase-like cupin family protein|nr:cupin domain-containing protein [Myxococcales bacterium]